MTELSTTAPLGYIIGARDLDDDGRREAAHWQVFTDVESCSVQRRKSYGSPTDPDLGSYSRAHLFFDCELRWPTGLPDRLYIAIAQRNQTRFEVAHHDFRATLPEAQSDIDDLRRTYPEYSASVARFLVCEIHEVTA